MSAVARDLAGVIVGGNYRITHLLGVGGMGEVWQAIHQVAQTPAAVKVLGGDIAANAALRSRFLVEATAGMKVRHENIVQVFDCGELPDGRPWMLMDFLEGGDLEGYVRSHGQLAAEDTLRIVAQIGRGLVVLHKDHGIIHRDLKPPNVFLTDGARRRVKLLDFGLAKVAPAPGGARLTRVGMIAGTPHYCAPEQISSFGDVDGRADIYSLGWITFFCLTGQLPYASAASEADPRAVTAILEAQRQDPSLPRRILDQYASTAGHVPAGWIDHIERAVAYHVESRYQSVPEYILALAADLPGGEAIARSLAPELYQTAAPDDRTAKTPSSKPPTLALRVGPPPAAPPISQPTTHGGAAGARPTGVAQVRRAAPWVAGLAAVAALIAVAVFTLGRGDSADESGSDERSPEPAAAADSGRAPGGGRTAPTAPAADPPPPVAPPASPAMRKVRIVTEPAGGIVAIDGAVFGPAPLTAALADGATVSVRAELAGHEAAVQSVRVADGMAEIRLSLAPSPAAAGKKPAGAGTSRPSKSGGTRKPPRPAVAPADPPPKRPTFDPNRPIGPQ